MDVHPPHEPVHSWRDALTHIGIMTVGLFIALMLEAGVEALHHRELVKQARENIHRELEQNHHNAGEDILLLGHSGDKIKAGVATLRYLQAHRGAKDQTISFTVEFEDLSDAAWRTARDTGALGFMPLDEVQRFAAIYALQESVSNDAFGLLKAQAEGLAPIMIEEPDFAKMPDAEFARLRESAATNYSDVVVLQQLLRNLDHEYVDALNVK